MVSCPKCGVEWCEDDGLSIWCPECGRITRPDAYKQYEESEEK